MSVELSVSGQCPVQGYAVVRGHLVYFRARDSWALMVWAPGEWTSTHEGPEADVDAALRDLGRREWGTKIRVDERDETTPGFPAWESKDENDGSGWRYHESYPGWWSHGYALRVFEWAVGRAVPGARGDDP